MTQPDPDAAASPLPEPTIRPASFRKYLQIIRVTLIERLTYRLDFLLTTFLRFIPTLTTILLWRAVYDGVQEQSGDRSLSNYKFEEMIAYLLIVNISRMFSSMPGLAGGIARDIREGGIKKYLTQPIDMIHYLVSYRVAHKLAYIASSALPYAVLFFICRRFFYDHVPTDAATWCAYAASLAMAFLVGFFFEASVGMVGFWFLEVTSILWIVMTLNFFVSGHMFPLDLLPSYWAGFLKVLPFQYMAYFPAAVFLGKIQGRELVVGLVLEFFWAAVFILACRTLYNRGLRRYGAYGG